MNNFSEVVRSYLWELQEQGFVLPWTQLVVGAGGINLGQWQTGGNGELEFEGLGQHPGSGSMDGPTHVVILDAKGQIARIQLSEDGKRKIAYY